MKGGFVTRDQALAAVSGWVERIGATQDPSLSLRHDAIDDAVQLAGFLDDSGEDLEIRLALGWMLWYQHLALKNEEDMLREAVRAFMPCFIAGFGSFPEPVMPLLADAADGPTGALIFEASTSTDPAMVARTVGVWRRIVGATPTGHPFRPGRLSGLGNVLRFSYQLSGVAAELDESIACHREAVATSPADHPQRAGILGNLALALRVRISRSGEQADLDADLDEAIAALTEAVAIPGQGETRRNDLSDLGAYLRVRFSRSGNPADLEQAIALSREAVSGVSADNPRRRVLVANLAAALHARFDQSGIAADLDEAVSLYGAALDGVPAGDPNLALMASRLGIVLRARFERAGAAPDLTAAITWQRTALNATSAGDAEHAARLAELATGLHLWFELTGDTAGLDEAVTASREAVSLTDAADPYLEARLDRLRVVLQDRFHGAGAPADLEEVIPMYRAAVAVAGPDDPDRARLLCNLGNALLDRFGQAGEDSDLEEAVALHRAAVAATARADSRRAVHLAALANSLWYRFNQLGRDEDLNEAIALLRETLAAARADSYLRPKYLTNLGTALRERYGRTAAQADLDEAITLLREAVAEAPAGQPLSALYLSNLGAALRTRYGRAGSTEDLAESVAVARQALSAVPPGHPQRSRYQSNLGAALQLQYQRTGPAADLDEAIALQRAAAADTAARPAEAARYRYNLSVALVVRYRKDGSLDDLNESVTVGRAVLAATPAGRPERAAQLNHLGDALWNRFDRTGSAADLDEAVTVLKDSVAATPPGHPGRAAALTNLGAALRSRFRRPGGSDPADLHEAVETLDEATRTAQGRPSERIRAARLAADLLAGRDVHLAAGLLELAVQLLPEVAPRELTGRDKQYQLGDEFDLGTNLAGDAAALVLADDPAGSARALGLLELGRAVLLTQSLETRGDVRDLQAREPTLARRFVELRDALDQAQASPEVAADDGPADGPQDRRDLHRLAADFGDVLGRIRAIPGFAEFLRPPSADQLVAQAGQGAIVVLNVSQYRGDAIVIRPQGITGIPLPGLQRQALAGKINAFYQFLGQADDAAATIEQRQAAQRSVADTLEWLWDVVAEPVLTKLGYLHTPATGTAWPHLWWAPGGLLGTLPVHAAGYHRPGPAQAPGRTVMDRVISSYTPTVRTLVYARERSAGSATGPLPALVVAMPVTPGLPPLRFAAREVSCVREHIPQADVYVESETGVTDRTPTTERALALMAPCAVAHFACHGSNDLQDPSRSQLYLHDHAERPLTVAALSAIRLERAQLAYLSACGTALNRNPRLLDEAIHLTAAFQLTGFARVIGTLWPIDDAISALIADSFYSGLRAGDGTMDLSCAAAALHHAQRAARDALTDYPSRWAPYIHMGA